jgi:hypothetical protein
MYYQVVTTAGSIKTTVERFSPSDAIALGERRALSKG